VSPDLSTAITFGIINIITSIIAVLLAYFTLRYMVLEKSSSSLSLLWSSLHLFCSSVSCFMAMNRNISLACHLCPLLPRRLTTAYPIAARDPPQHFENALFHRHEHTYLIPPQSPQASHAQGMSLCDTWSNKDSSGPENS
jgi:hypothetical protein